MCPDKISSTLVAATLVAALCLAWPLHATGQGYTHKSPLTGAVYHSPIPEGGNQICDYWDKDFLTYSDGTWEVLHFLGPLVKKEPNRQAAIVWADILDNNYDPIGPDEIYFSRVKFRDIRDGSVLVFKPQGKPRDFITGILMTGEWVERSSSRKGLITCAVYEQSLKRVLLWFTYPDSQYYGTAVLNETAQGLDGSYTYAGRTGPWTLTTIRE